MKILITNLESVLSNGCVHMIHWTASKKYKEFIAYEHGYVSLESKDSSDPTYIPYVNLTETDVINWFKQSVGSTYLESVEETLDNQIELYKNPTQFNGIPWVQEHSSE